MFKKVIDILFFGSIYIAICAVAFCIQTNLLLHVPLNHYSFYLFVFGATLAQYNLHYLVKKTAGKNSERFAWSSEHKQIHLILIVTGILTCLYCLFFFELHNFIFLGMVGLVAFLYSYPALPFGKKKRLKDFGLIKIFTLALLWTIVTVWFPVDEINISAASFQLVFVRRFIFMFMLCLLFDIRDMDTDKQENIGTIPVKLGLIKSYTIVYILLGTFLCLSVYELILSGNIVMFNAFFLSTIVSFFLIRLSRKYPSDYIYLAGLDGMMLLQCVLVAIGSN